jgi:transglutaminase-like putative cysteine protease
VAVVTSENRLRLAVFVTTCAAMWTLVAGGLLSPVAGVLGSVLLAGSSAWSSRRLSEHARKWTSTGLVGSTLVLGLVTVARGGLAEAGSTLAVLLLGLTVAHSLVLETVRDLRVGLALGAAMALVAAGLAPGPALAAPVTVGWVAAVTALVLAHDGRMQSGVDAVLAAPGAARARGRVPLTVLTAVLVGLLAFLLLPRPPSLAGPAAGGGPGDRSADAEPAGRGAQAWSSGVLDMRWRGELSDAPVLSVTGGPPTLWRGAVLDTYDGHRWSVGRRGTMLLGTGPGVTVPAAPGDPSTAVTTTRTDVVRPAGRPYDAIVAPGRPLTVSTERRVVSSDGLLYLAPPGEYTVTSAAPEADSAVLRAAAGPDPADNRWTLLPADLPARVTALGRDLAGTAPTRYDAVRAVEDYLRSHATYRLDSRVPGPGEDAVDAFLFTDRTGFCEQFAAAGVVLLRAAGIPARLVTGFSGGDPDGDRRVLREADAHAWAEVWFPGVGWVASDPTAGAVPVEGPRDWIASVRSAITTRLATVQGRLVLAAGLGVVVLAGLVVVHRRRWILRLRNRPTAADAPPSTDRSEAVTAYRRWEAALAAAGAPRRPDEGLADLAARNPAAAGALQVVGRALYAPRPPSPAESREAAEKLDRLAAELLTRSSELSPSTRSRHP